jgi:Restriction endonuclease fold toxin 5
VKGPPTGAYQEQIAGEDVGLNYRVGNVKFDGYSNGVLQDAKGERYAWAVKDGEFIKNYDGAQGLVEDAERQVAAANGAPITWSVAEEPVVSAIITSLQTTASLALMSSTFRRPGDRYA